MEYLNGNVKDSKDGRRAQGTCDTYASKQGGHGRVKEIGTSFRLENNISIDTSSKRHAYGICIWFPHPRLLQGHYPKFCVLQENSNTPCHTQAALDVGTHIVQQTESTT